MKRADLCLSHRECLHISNTGSSPTCPCLCPRSSGCRSSQQMPTCPLRPRAHILLGNLMLFTRKSLCLLFSLMTLNALFYYNINYMHLNDTLTFLTCPLNCMHRWINFCAPTGSLPVFNRVPRASRWVWIEHWMNRGRRVNSETPDFFYLSIHQTLYMPWKHWKFNLRAGKTKALAILMYTDS